MKLSNNGYQFICQEEGIRLTAYKDITGTYTIGAGLLGINGVLVHAGQTITAEQAEQEFMRQIVTYEEGVNQLVKVQLTQNQFDSLISFVWNLGVHALAGSTLLKVINRNPNDSTIPQHFQEWDRAAGKVSQGLLNRRIAEAKLYFTV